MKKPEKKFDVRKEVVKKLKKDSAAYMDADGRELRELRGSLDPQEIHNTVIEPRVEYASGGDTETHAVVSTFRVRMFKPGDKVEVVVRRRV